MESLREVKERLLAAAGSHADVERECVLAIMSLGVDYSFSTPGQDKSGVVRYVLNKKLLEIAPELVLVRGIRDKARVGKLLKPEAGEVVSGVMGELGFDDDFVPAGPLLQEVLALLVKVRNVLLPLTGGSIEKRDAFVLSLLKKVRDFSTPDTVFALGVEQVLELGK